MERGERKMTGKEIMAIAFFKIENYDIIEASHWKMIYGMIKIGLFSVKGDIV